MGFGCTTMECVRQVISDACWHRGFGADTKVVGKKIRVDGDLYTIAGVLPPDFHPPGRADRRRRSVGHHRVRRNFRRLPFAPSAFFPGLWAASSRDLVWLRRKRNSTISRHNLRASFPTSIPWPRDGPSGWFRFSKIWSARSVRSCRCFLRAWLSSVNLANLLLARATNRQREMAIRLAVGAGRLRLITQLLTESILLATISGAAALITVVWLKSSLLHLAPAHLPRLSEVSVSSGVLSFAFLISILTGVIFGLAPALQAAGTSHAGALREGTRGAGTSHAQLKFSRILVASEIALSLVRLIGAGLLIRSFERVLEVQPGFEPHQLVTAKIWLAVPKDPKDNPYFTPEKQAALHREILQRIEALPGVEQAAIGGGTSLPMDFNHFQSPFLIENHPLDVERTPTAEIASVSAAYFSVLRTPLLTGRFFVDSEDTKGQQVALIDETLAHRCWPRSDSDAIGQRLQLAVARRGQTSAAQNPWVTIVGVVGSIKSDGFDTATAPHICFPVLQTPPYSAVVFLGRTRGFGRGRTHGDSARGSGIPVFSVRTMDAVISTFLAERRFALLGLFAGVALLLASVGIYGVMAYTFSRRTNEIGIRIAMGAQRTDIFRMALEEGAVTIALGVGAGLLGALALTRFLESMRFSVRATDPLTFGAIAALLAAVTPLACLLSAERATHVHPLVALRRY